MANPATVDEKEVPWCSALAFLFTFAQLIILVKKSLSAIDWHITKKIRQSELV